MHPYQEQVKGKMTNMCVMLCSYGIAFTYILFLYINLFIYLFLAVSGLCCCVRAFSSCGKQGLLFIAVCGLLIVVASLVVERGL